MDRGDRPRSGTRTWRIVAMLAVPCVLILTSGILVSAQLEASPFAGVSGSATALGQAVRGRSEVITPLPPPPVLYPTGVCDGISAGLPGLNGPFPTSIRAIGTSVQGRIIWAEYWGPAIPTTVVVVVAQVHGNECSPTLVVDALRRQPTSSSVGVWLIPTLNPDGYAGYTRENANGVDLNADGGRVSQPETRALMAFLQEIRPVLTVHVHSPNGFAGIYPASAGSRAAPICQAIGVLTAIGCAAGGAGARSDSSRWFLWQGHAPFTDEALLVELHAVADAEVPMAQPRPATRSVEAVRSEAQVVAALLVR